MQLDRAWAKISTSSSNYKLSLNPTDLQRHFFTEKFTHVNNSLNNILKCNTKLKLLLHIYLVRHKDRTNMKQLHIKNFKHQQQSSAHKLHRSCFDKQIITHLTMEHTGVISTATSQQWPGRRGRMATILSSNVSWKWPITLAISSVRSTSRSDALRWAF